MSDSFSRYRILRPIGSGGMGAVFLAEDTRLGRHVALKLLPPDAGRDSARRRRFLQEARAAARLNHPNICTVLDAGEADRGQLFITMELIEGTSLAERCRGGAVPREQVIEIGLQTAAALDQAHRMGIVHRDLKPANLMLTPSGQVKVIDFGLAKAEWGGGVSEGGDLEPTQLRTEPGLVLGTFAYMSPEQALGRDVDARSDIFSLGAVLYRLAAGRAPFPGSHPLEVVSAVVHADPPLLDPNGSEGLDSVIRRCLEKAPERRYESMTELIADLERLRGGSGGRTRASSPPRRKHNLPVPTTRFIGREREVHELTGLLRVHRLVTVTGAGGSGKTRLAFEVAARLAEDLPDGAWQASLASFTSGDQVDGAVAETLGIKEHASRPALEVLAEHLASREMLLVLDSCEHVLDATAPLVEAILRRAPKVRMIATSQEALNVPGECAWPAPPLAAPAGRGPVGLEEAKTFDSVRLFLDRARARDPRFALTESNLEAVVGICIRLDGIPLAIELAAARVQALSAAEIRRRLDDCFGFLTSGSRGSPPRHQTLRAALDWSHSLLEPGERELFRQLACFEGGFDLESVEAVCGGRGGASTATLDRLSRLIEKSLVVSGRAADDRVRYRLLEPLRAYAREKLLESGEEEKLARFHFDHYASMADRAYEQRIAAGPAWLERLERDHDNLRAALDWAARSGPEHELRLAGALAWFWQLHSHYSEGRRRLVQALERPPGRTRDAARALWGASTLAVWQGDVAAARRPGEESLAIWRELGDAHEVALALEPIGWSRFFSSDIPGALAAFEESLAIYGGLHDRRMMNRARLNICQVLVELEDVERAEPLAREALELATETGELWDLHFSNHFLGDCALLRGDAETAAPFYRESLRASLAYGDRFETVFEIEGSAMVLAALGRDAKAMRLMGAAAAEREALQNLVTVRFWEALKERYLGPSGERLGPEAADRERRHGRAMGFDAAVAYALDFERD